MRLPCTLWGDRDVQALLKRSPVLAVRSVLRFSIGDAYWIISLGTTWSVTRRISVSPRLSSAVRGRSSVCRPADTPMATRPQAIGKVAAGRIDVESSIV